MKWYKKKSGSKQCEWGCRRQRNKRRVKVMRPPKTTSQRDGVSTPTPLCGKSVFNMTGFGYPSFILV